MAAGSSLITFISQTSSVTSNFFSLKIYCNYILYFLKYQKQSVYFKLFWLAIVLNECELKFMFRRVGDMRSLSKFKLSSLTIVMGIADAENGL